MDQVNDRWGPGYPPFTANGMARPWIMKRHGVRLPIPPAGMSYPWPWPA